jgi:hypothetical protein
MTLLGMIGPQEIMIILLAFSFILLLPLLALISVLRNDFQGNDKLIWVLIILLLPFLGAILYFIIGREKRLKRND